MVLRAALLMVALALWLYPPRFRRRFGTEMREVFRERMQHEAMGVGAASRILLVTLADLTASAAKEWCRPLGGRSRQRTTTRGGREMGAMGHDAPRSKVVAAGSRRRWLADAMAQDLRFGLRSLTKRPGFTAVVVFTLAVGIAANTSVFSVVNAVLLTPLPYPEPERVVTMWSAYDSPARRGSMSIPDLEDIEALASLESVVGYDSDEAAWTGSGDAELLASSRVSGGLLDVFGLEPVLGREIGSHDAVDGGPDIVVISHRLWQDRFNGSPDVLGETLELDGRNFEVVGVAPQGFDFPAQTDVWLPYPDREGCGRGCHQLRGVGRLVPGTAVEVAQQESGALAERLQDDFPDSNTGKDFGLTPLAEEMVADIRAGLWTLLGAVGLVLLIVCANVANLLLVRAQTRTGEVAVRAALGASRARIAMQVMVESVVLATFGGAAGLALTFLGVRAIRALAPADVPRLDQVGVDGPTLWLALGLVVLVALLFGALPALRLARTAPAMDLASSGGRSGVARVGARSRNLLLIGEVGLSVVLLVGAGLFLRSFVQLVRVDPGYQTQEVVRFSLWLPENRYGDLESFESFFGLLEDRILATPGVESVGSVLGAPLHSANILADVVVEGRSEPAPGQVPEVYLRPSTSGYFETLGISVVRGRGIEAADGPRDRPVAVITQALADQVFPGEEALGRRIQMTADFGYGKPYFEIVGVVPDVLSQSLTNAEQPAVYVPISQLGPGYATVHVRSSPGASALASDLRAVVGEIDPDLPLRGLETMEQAVSGELAPGRFYLSLIGFFALVAVGLAATGLYGVVAYLVTLRTRELGVRSALGAGRSELVGLLVGQGMRPAVLGVVVGGLVAFAGASVLEGLLFEVNPRDPFVYGGVMVLLLAVVLMASAIPAWRATRIRPRDALRVD
jgi:predicted permease